MSAKKDILCLGDKVKVIEANKKDTPLIKIVSQYGVGTTQIGNIFNQEEILKQLEQGILSKRKVLYPRRSTFHQVNAGVMIGSSELVLNIYKSQKHYSNKKLEIDRKLGNNDFNASNGWLFKFQQCHDSSRILSGEAAGISDEDLCNWYQYLLTLCKDYERKNIFNVDETGILFREAPTQSVVNNGYPFNGLQKAKGKLYYWQEEESTMFQKYQSCAFRHNI